MMRQLRSMMFVCVSAAIPAWLAAGAQANLLQNPGFEEEDMSGGTEDGQTGPGAAAAWIQFSGSGVVNSRDNTMPRSGDWDYLLQTSNDTSGFAGAFQSIAVSEGVNYLFSVWAKVDEMADGMPGVDDSGDLNSEARIRVEWRGDSGEISRDQINITSSLSSSYQLFSLSAVAPAGATEARPVIALNANNDAFYFDDASFVIPEPLSGVLLLLGLSGLAFRRR